MEFRKIKNKEGEVLKTEEGKELVELRVEVGDEIIPLYNSILENTKEVEQDGKKKKITNYSLKVRARDTNGQVVEHDGSDEIFIGLTPAQATSLKKKIEEGVELNQNIFVAYTYESKDYGEQIGIGLKKAHKPAKTFEDFDGKNEEIVEESKE